MDITRIKLIINSELPDEFIEDQLLTVLASDSNVIPTIMKILERERKIKHEVQTEMNVLLSKTHLALDNKNLNKNGFMQKEIISFYTKYKDYVSHCFKNLFE